MEPMFIYAWQRFYVKRNSISSSRKYERNEMEDDEKKIQRNDNTPPER